jgi:hypothetical protein
MEIVGIEEFHFFDLILGIKATEELINREENANTSLLIAALGLHNPKPYLSQLAIFSVVKLLKSSAENPSIFDLKGSLIKTREMTLDAILVSVFKSILYKF